MTSFVNFWYAKNLPRSNDPEHTQTQGNVILLFLLDCDGKHITNELKTRTNLFFHIFFLI